MILATISLSGCPAGVAPLAGLKKGEEERASKVICCTEDESGERNWTIYEKRVDHIYDLLFSPEGDKKNVHLKYSYRYYLKSNDTHVSALSFLNTSPRWDYRGNFEKVHHISTSKLWIGYGQVPVPWDSKAVSTRYFVKVFSAEAVLYQMEIDVSKKNPNIEYLREIPALRFHASNGVALYLINENRIVPQH